MQAIKDYENNKWKVIGQKVGKPAKVRTLFPFPFSPSLLGFVLVTIASHLTPSRFRSCCAGRETLRLSRFDAACGWSRTKTFIGSEAEPEKHGISLLARHVGKPIPTKPVLSAYTAKPYNPRAFSYAPTRSPLYRILGHVVPLPALLFPPQSLPLHPPVTLSSSTLLEHHSAYLHGALRAYAVAKEAPASKGHITDHVSSSRQ